MKAWNATLDGAARQVPVLVDGLAVMTPFKSRSVEVAGIDKDWRVALGDKFFEYDRRQRIAILIHECLHVVCHHHEREIAALHTDHELSNLAQDFEINQMIQTLPGMELPKEAMFPNKHGFHLPLGKTMESYYLKMDGPVGERNQTDIGRKAVEVNREKREDRQKLKDALRGNSELSESDRGNSGNGSGSGGDKRSNIANQTDPTDNADGSNDSDGAGDSSESNQTGSSTTNGDKSGRSRFDRMRDRHPEAPEPGMCGSGASDRIEAEADRMGIAKISGATISKANEKIASKAKDPNFWGSSSSKDFAMQLSAVVDPPRVNWRQVFRRVITNAYSGLSYKRTEYSYRRINRRGNAFMKNIAFPGMVSYTPKALMAIDTSASMSEDELRYALMEVEGIVRQVGHGSKDAFQAFCVDTDMKKVQIVNRVEDIDITGGGGTDMSPAFVYAGSLPKRLRPDVFILVTDCGLDWNKVAKVWPQQIKVVILCTDHSGYEMVKAKQSWLLTEAKVIDISEKDDYSYGR